MFPPQSSVCITVEVHTFYKKMIPLLPPPPPLFVAVLEQRRALNWKILGLIKYVYKKTHQLANIKTFFRGIAIGWHSNAPPTFALAVWVNICKINTGMEHYRKCCV